ncbi:MAG: hypothetical protein AMXMBFR84_21870 [Candidatus Hydrogenedentota bacterium]
MACSNYVGRALTRILIGALVAFHCGVSYASDTGSVFIELNNTLGMDLPGYVEIYAPKTRKPSYRFELPKGSALQECAPGEYEVFVYAVDYDLEILVDIQKIVVEKKKSATVLVEIVEGIGNSGIRAWDQDFDGTLDRVERAYGTDPFNPTSFPKAEPLPFDSPVLSPESRWYKGDLHVRSSYGGGSQTPSEIIRRAEAEGLDFIAIADRNTFEACMDAGYQSNKVVLIPAMEWGTDEKGIALILGPQTMPQSADTIWEAQTICQRVQAQGGVFAVAHPCFSNAPWQWGLSYVNAIEVWTRGWREIPPMALNELMPVYQQKHQRKLVHSIALAADSVNNSANGQAVLFWDHELVRGLKACAIAGSLSSNSTIPLGRPVTHVFAREKSVRGILEGIRLGRTYVASGPDAPVVQFTADAMKNGKVDVGLGGVVPLGMDVEFQVKVGQGKGKKLELLRNGYPILSQKIEHDNSVFSLTDHTTGYSAYRARVIDTPATKGFGPMEVLVMTSPIYAQNIVPIDLRRENPADTWIRLENSTLPPVKVTQKVDDNDRVLVQTEGGPPDVNSFNTGEEFTPPPGEEVRTLKPKTF